MIGYIEGIKSNNISKKYLKSITKEIDKKYQDGLKGISIQYLPEAGIHILVSTYNLRELYFGNIKLLNSEIFSYVLYAFSKVVTLHSFQILDPTGYSLRLSFGIKKHIHTGMKAIHDLLDHLTLKPSIKTSRP
jgi:DNA phosphorothioation-dependent restriction protein DptG